MSEEEEIRINMQSKTQAQWLNLNFTVAISVIQIIKSTSLIEEIFTEITWLLVISCKRLNNLLIYILSII